MSPMARLNWSAFLGVDLQSCKTMTDTLAPVKNRLKRPKIKRGTTLKVNCTLLNRLLSPVLLNKSGLARAKAVNFNSFFKQVYLITTRCKHGRFSQTVTYVSAKTGHVRTC